jgi:hypothetical protein
MRGAVALSERKRRRSSSQGHSVLCERADFGANHTRSPYTYMLNSNFGLYLEEVLEAHSSNLQSFLVHA